MAYFRAEGDKPVGTPLGFPRAAPELSTPDNEGPSIYEVRHLALAAECCKTIVAAHYYKNVSQLEALHAQRFLVQLLRDER